ncbi:DUF885 domain-containing protein [Shewanella surugensis]|uniref:DUF885 domain-containing protein n=1 Tax=Shewanella surugensis TaxID=212020 RepID=A0ABT0LCK1_9GAMM|nr:DUF885 domain-containing protein [Shewanella surugensis]MCL1125399.1 DUF885 domain-containing protein [Shewanella surugensis]
MKKAVLAIWIGLALGVSGCSQNEPKEATSTVDTQVTKSDAQEQVYLTLVDDYFKDFLRLDPLEATFSGINDYNHKFTNKLTEDYLERRHGLNSQYLAKLKKIDRQALSPALQLSYDVFMYDRNMALANEAFPQYFMPMDQFSSDIITMVQLGSGDSAQPFYTVGDYENWLARVKEFIQWLGDAQARMNEGIESQVVLPRVLVERMIPQLQAQLVEDVTKSVFYQPITQFPNDFSETDQQALTTQYRALILDELIPALSGFKTYLETRYLPAARGSDGWWGLPNGKLWYQQLANKHTTTTMPVDDIHQMGLTEVARIRSEMDKVREQVGFKGDLSAFFGELSSNPQYFFKNKEALIHAYMQLKDKINAKLPEYFDVMPKADYVVKPVESFREQSAAGASYEAPAVDGSRPGVFYINTYNLKAQPKWGTTTLSLHEAAPGHHFQIAIKQELTGVPEFQRFGSYNAFEEGWALYAEYLGVEMGLFSDPYQYFGKLADEMLRAMRLVVDTGLHAKGWSREQAIQYMKDNSPMAESDIIAEVERYMAIPGQALSYKVGQLKILALREETQAALGEQFDLRAFHDQVLTSGALPMEVLTLKIQNWTASQLKKQK